MKYLIALLLALSLPAQAVNLTEYFPPSSTVLLTKSDGKENARYTFTQAPQGFIGLYYTFLNINKPGYHYTWRKEYKINGVWCTVTFAVLFMGDDGSVTEVGDWLSSGGGCTPNTVFGYRDTNTNIPTGLMWSPAGGLTTIPATSEMDVISQESPGAAFSMKGYQTYSRVGLVEKLDEYTPPYGRDLAGNWCAGCARTYRDVVHIVMYHGTRNASTVPIRCGNLPISANGPYYQSFKNYNSYAIELWISKSHGIIQENTPFIEDAAYWGGKFPNCSGGLFSEPYRWTKFIDEK